MALGVYSNDAIDYFRHRYFLEAKYSLAF